MALESFDVDWDYKGAGLIPADLIEYLTGKYLTPFLQKGVARQSGKSMVFANLYVDLSLRVATAAKEIGILPRSSLPLYMNHEDPIFQDAVQWRLQQND